MNVTVDSEVCVGTQNCVATAPDYFQLDNRGRSQAMKNPVAKEDEDLMLEAARSCPVGAVILKEADGEQIFP